MFHHTLVIILFCLSILIPREGTTQIVAPDLLCISNDTLIWDIPVNTCGAFNTYEIYVGNSINGPFNLLTQITNPAQGTFFHVNPNAEIRYYYMSSDFNCPGQQVLTSDTINNQFPEITSISSLSVSGTDVEIRWPVSNSQEVRNYIIYRTTSAGVTPIDTVQNTTFYIDRNAAPTQQAETYFILAVDRCLHTSLFDNPQSTMLLRSEVSICEQSITLTWNPYENWIGGTSRQEVWVSIDGAAPQLAATIGANASTYTFTNANDNSTYCFSIRSFNDNLNTVASSSEACETLDIVQPIRNLILKNVSVNVLNEVNIEWCWDIDAEINNMEVLRSEDAINDFTSIHSTPITAPLILNNDYQDLSSNASLGKQFYRIETTDDCDTTALSNYGSTIFLSGLAAEGFVNQLSWTALDINGAQPLVYELYRLVGTQSTWIATLDVNTLNYEDLVDASNPQESSVCYYVVCQASFTLPDSSVENIVSRSNTICVQQFSTVYVPNAFAPDGRNQIFKPVIVFGDNAEYNMSIYSRWGQKVFESSAPDIGWNGRYEGQNMPAGSYAYLIQITQPNGREEIIKGSLILIR